MCLGLPMQIQSVDGLVATCRGMGRTETVSLALIGDGAPGDHMLCYLGTAIRRLGSQEAAEIEDALRAVEAASEGRPFEHLLSDLIDREPQLPAHLRPPTPNARNDERNVKMHPILQSLCAETSVTTLGADDIEGFISGEHPLLRILFLAGDPEKKLETADVVVVLRELLREWPGAITVGVPTPQAQSTAMKQTGVHTLPSLVFFARGQKLETLPKVQDWSVYAETLTRLIKRTTGGSIREGAGA